MLQLEKLGIDPAFLFSLWSVRSLRPHTLFSECRDGSKLADEIKLPAQRNKRMKSPFIV
jgi:hypothetical protein